jgi:Zn-dependent protease
MIKPEVIRPDDDFDVIVHVFEAPLVVKGRTWYPLTQVITWLVMAREAGRLYPERRWRERLLVASATMPVILGSEWCHNLAHAAAAKLVGHPVDAIRITWGMPMLVYHDIEDTQVTPRQHIVRSLGGPIFNLVIGLPGIIFRKYNRKGSPGRDIADALTWTNFFLAIVGMVPQPWLDGGAVLKWALVERGNTLEEADETVRKVNYPAAAGMGIGAAVAFKQGKKLLGWVLSLLAAISIGTAAGWYKEK